MADTKADTKDQPLEAAYRRLLDERLPGHERLRVAWSGGTAHAVVAGEGPPLVVVHGGMGEILQWLPILPSLARAHRVVVVDRPGQGLSDPFDYRGVDLYAHAADYLGAVLDAAGLQRATLVGNSMGGLFSIAFALQRPERVTRLILVGAPAGSNERLPRRMLAMRLPGLRALVRLAITRSTDLAGIRRFLDGFIVAHADRIPEDLLEGMAASTRRNIATSQSLLERVLTWRGTLRRDLLLEKRWASLRVPVHFVWGDEDAFDPPAHGAALLPFLPSGSRLASVPDAGHCPWLDAPEAVSRHVLAAAAGDEPAAAARGA